MAILHSKISALLLTILVTMTGLALGDPDHWIITQAQPIMIARVDPIVSPYGISSHVHHVVGASNFGWHVNSPDVQQEAACSSAVIGDDKSNYWAPQPYYQFPNGTFAPLLGGSRIYYFTKGNVKPFPPALQMISGTAMSKDLSDTRTLGVQISCDHGQATKWLPNGTSHPGGCSAISLGIFFPSCGLENGALDSDDHFSHMAWPQSHNGSLLVDDPNGEECPDSHPIKYPTIFAEFNYYLDDAHPWRNDPCTLILANGDCSGNTFHADFVNGWKASTLQAGINQCGDGKGPGDQPAACAPFRPTVSEENTWECRLEGQIPDEQVGLVRPIDDLPGCNPVWKSNVSKKPGCNPAVQNPGWVAPNTYFENLKFRNHIPMALPEVQNASEAHIIVPSLGDTGASKVGEWGTEGSNPDKQQVGTWQAIINSLAPDVTPGPVVALAAAIEPTTSEAESSTVSSQQADAANVIGVAALATNSASDTSSSKLSVDTATSTASTCKPKKKRGIISELRDVQNHFRRSRHRMVDH
ncbi:hypothetical protein CI109_105737 [Kwoniella shandongensis]|uniref:Uncharacterized protein n=1 Tax=Kwoniella shandongensis TaxID=1734106 RepID=A0A5M6C4Y6_9TREE|nr:uncharacterized protein CI109_003077 [Kwoniella shandongensis]KAA5528545.1 hypothetical protein CI109_003077 [Kwoniella shandongensis]